jgi:cystathionine beta-lyase
VREKFSKQLHIIPYDESGTLALVAGRAAYEKGADWMDELKKYLWENIAYVRTFLKENLPKVKLVEPEGTYLVWLDFTAYDMTPEELEHRMLHEAKIWLDDGTMFGEEGAMFERVNIACPRSILVKAMNQLKDAFGDL